MAARGDEKHFLSHFLRSPNFSSCVIHIFISKPRSNHLTSGCSESVFETTLSLETSKCTVH